MTQLPRHVCGEQDGLFRVCTVGHFIFVFDVNSYCFESIVGKIFDILAARRVLEPYKSPGVAKAIALPQQTVDNMDM